MCFDEGCWMARREPRSGSLLFALRYLCPAAIVGVMIAAFWK
jgi:hypothetical protein